MNVNEPIRGHSDDTQFFAALSDAGFPVSSIAAIRDQFDRLPTGLAELLLDWIPRLEGSPLQEPMAWVLLAAPKGALDGTKLAELFDSTTRIELKQALAAVIHQTRPRNLDEWLLVAVRDRRSEAAQRLLAAAVATMLPAERAIAVLIEVFEDAPLAAVHPLGKVGDVRVRDFLVTQQPTASGPLRRELRQAIARIERRLAKREKQIR